MSAGAGPRSRVVRVCAWCWKSLTWLARLRGFGGLNVWAEARCYAAQRSLPS
jgi:hypothetical protein